MSCAYVDAPLHFWDPPRLGRRLLLGSDWPVVKLAGGDARWLDAARSRLGPLPATAQAAIFAANARRIYRLDDPVPS